MSHWMQGKLGDLHCSLDKMKEAIVNIMPSWDGHIQTSPEGNITVKSSYNGDSKSGYHIRVAEGSDGVRYCDFGMKQLSDGTWQIEYDSMGLPMGINSPQDDLKNEIAAMAMKERASIDNLNMIEDSRENGRKQVIRMSPEEAKKFLESE